MIDTGPEQPIQALIVGVTKLCPADEIVEQMNLFDLEIGRAKRKNKEKLEALKDALCDKHGEGSGALGYQENKEIGVECGEGDGEDLLKNLSGFSIIITLCRIRTIEMV